MQQRVAFILIGAGVVLLIAYGARDFFLNDDIHLVIRIAVAIIGVGLLILLARVIKDRLARRKNEKELEGVEK